MFFDEKLIQSVAKKKCSDPSLLKIIADQRERFQKTILQFNKMYEEMPQQAKADKNLSGKLRSVHEADFKGALAEVVTNFILKHFKIETYYEPKIRTAKGLVTPDFYSVKSNRTFIVEVFSPGNTDEESRRENNLRNVYKELALVKGPFSITLFGYPTPDSNGEFHSLNKAMEVFLNSHSPEREVLRVVETKRGASVSFHFHEKRTDGGDLRFGWVDSQSRHNNFHLKIQKDLRSKRKAYKFPFVASCVLMPTVRSCDENSFYRALVGDPAIVVPVAIQVAAAGVVGFVIGWAVFGSSLLHKADSRDLLAESNKDATVEFVFTN